MQRLRGSGVRMCAHLNRSLVGLPERATPLLHIAHWFVDLRSLDASPYEIGSATIPS